MTISSFCRDQLLAHGPLPLQALADLAADAGKTTAKDPATAVRSALAYKEVPLADGRWATPLWLLEGRILTTSELPQTSETDGTHHDLALLDRATRSGPVPLAAGGSLRPDPYGYGWRVPKGWPGVAPGPDELLGLRVRHGEIHVELVPVDDELLRAGARLAEDVGSLDSPGRYWSCGDALVSENLVAALWERLAADPTCLTSPVPPFSQCIPALALALRQEHDRRASEASRWRPQLDLPAALQRVAVNESWRTGLMLDDWLNAHVTRTLHELDEDGMLDDGTYEPLPEQRRLRLM